MALTIQSPGVQISETDLSLTAPGIPPTTVFISGFAPKGPTSEPLAVASLSDFTQIYGAPTNAAERYFFQTAAAVFQSPANVLTYRLPYGVGAGVDTSSQFSALVYPVISVVNTSGVLGNLSGYNASLSANYTIPGLSAIYNAAYPGAYTAAVSAQTANLGISTLSATATSFFQALTTTTVSLPVTSVNVGITNGTYLFGAPTHIRLTQQQFLAIQSGSAFTWSASAADPYTSYTISNTGVNSLSANPALASVYVQPATTTFNTLSSLGYAGLIVLNISQNAINTRFEGNYVGVIDNTNLYPSTPFNDINNVNTVNTTATIYTPSNYVQIPSTRLNFPLSAGTTGTNGSISQVMENLPSFDITPTNFNDTIAFGLFKLRQSVFSPNTIALDYVLSESYVASLDYYRQINNRNGGPAISFFIGNTENNSQNVQVLVNPYISQQNTTGWLNLSGIPNKIVRLLNNARQSAIASDSLSNFTGALSSLPSPSNDTFNTRVGAPSAVYATALANLQSTDALFALGDYTQQDLSTKTIGNVPSKVTTMLNYIENAEVYPLSIVCEAGLGTIYANSNNPATSGYFDDTIPYTGTGITSLTAQNPSTPAQIITDYNSVAQYFLNFASNVRKDHLFIADPLTNIFIQGGKPGIKTLANPNNNFSLNIYWPLRNQFASFNTSYAAVYANIVQVYDNASNQQVWVPFSGFAAAAMANTDTNFQPWYAPAGFTRGILTGVLDLGYSPKQKERDQLYTISLNPVVFFPNEGYVIYGQKTAQKIPSAFDRINVRRLFLTLENQVNAVARAFVFEPNTLFTRTQLINTITPVFDYAKNTNGLYDYLIICDERNNTPSVIDQNELVVDIYLKPVRTAEFILVNFYATQTSANFAEIVA